ncbi:MAG TPA: glycosyltransferase family 4 protein [Clostridiales bacterium]|nr:glycosyltransferase family 4 protein [Clostridiales bacterium]HQK73319.1 glycosyltransferase family 4 protein [Clostridiales bacterium]
MKIAFLINSLESGGSERAASSLANYFVRCGHECLIITFFDEKPFYKIDERISLNCLHLTKSLGDAAARHDIAGYLKRSLRLRKMLKRLRPDILIGMSHVMSFYAVIASAFLRIKVVGTERSNPFLYQNTPYFRLIRKVSSLLADGYVFQTRGAMSYFPRKIESKAVVIPNALFNPLLDKIQPSCDKENTVTAVGRLEYVKGFDLLIGAFSDIAGQLPGTKLIIFGEGSQRPELEKIIREAGLEEIVLLPGADARAVCHVARSSLFVLPSRLEGMPNALMEAMACGTACIAADCDFGPRELIEDGENGILVPAQDREALAKAMLRVMSDSSLRRHIAEKAARFRSDYTMENIGVKWLDYLKRVSEES